MLHPCLQLNARAISEDGKKFASPTNLTIIVIDQNDNKPVFTENPFNGQVSEAESKGRQNDQSAFRINVF